MKATKDALAHAATGKGPVIIEAMTYRLSGHSTSDDPKAYRKEEVVEAWKKRDPMVRLRQHLEHESLWSDARQAELEGTLETKIKDAVTASEKKPAPALETMFEGVFAELPWNLKEQRDQLLRGPRAKGH
jgi:2-oxoisovalerate dehydrogenase E1 component alpha subunit